MSKTSKIMTPLDPDAFDAAPERVAAGQPAENFSYGDDENEAQGAPSAAVSTEDAARYIADMVAALVVLAREAKLDLLSYLLDMAHVEAELQARRREIPDEEA